MKEKKYSVTAAVCAVLTILLIVLLRTVDVAAIGPAGTSIGLSRLNQTVHELTGVNMNWYEITEWLGRLVSGVHWFTDILGGLLISGALLAAFTGVLHTVREKKEL